jgi:hypothetical protein
MPREAIRISLSPSFPPEAGATFFSTIAYPEQSEMLERDHFWFALCRWAISQRCCIDPEWGFSPQLIRPDIFLRLNTNWLQVFNRGMKRWEDRLIVTKFLAMPHFIAQSTEMRGLPRVQLKIEICETNNTEWSWPPLPATVDNMSEYAIEYMGASGKTQRNFRTRFWKPTRAVVHAAAAFLSCGKTIYDELDPKVKIDDPVLACLHFPNFLKKIILRSEIYRRQLASITQFKIDEEETIAFYY